ncbi:MAG: helix-turn-helix domain-containing protein [Spirochaetes bacterium]|nr:helix-turn-helix domain-containing protein [Spirochaetota bacterium]
MIQVIDRTFRILEHIQVNNGVQLRDIAASADLPKNTTANILKTLKDLGYIAKDEDGRYSLASKMRSFGVSADEREALRKALTDALHALAENIQEYVVLTFLNGYDRYIYAKATIEQEVTMNTVVLPAPAPIYQFATGRVLLAHLNAQGIENAVAHNGLPGKEWPEAMTLEKLQKELRMIREQHYSITLDAMHGIAIPVINGDDTAYALGVAIPRSRSSEARIRDVHREMIKTAEKMSGSIAVLCGRAKPPGSDDGAVR